MDARNNFDHCNRRVLSKIKKTNNKPIVEIKKYLGTSSLYFDLTDKNLKEAKDSWGWEKDDANLIFKTDSSFWDRESWADVIQQGKITVEEQKL